MEETCHIIWSCQKAGHERDRERDTEREKRTEKVRERERGKKRKGLCHIVRRALSHSERKYAGNICVISRQKRN